MAESLSISGKGRFRLSLVIREAGGLVSIDDVSATLGLNRIDAAKLLSRWQKQGWVKRLRRGVYAPVPLTAFGQEQVLEDPWIMIPELFGPAYVGGWSAAEYWGLTEQLFRGICIFTAKPVRNRELVVQGTPFVLKHVRPDAIFGTRAVWRDSTRILVSDPARTLVDMLDDPATGGGIRHVADCLKEYLALPDEKPENLLMTAGKLGNGAVFKRLGFLLEHLKADLELIASCKERLTKGNTTLDPALPCDRLVRRWRIWIPASWTGKGRGRD